MTTGALRHGRYCPARWVVWLANYGLCLAGGPVAFEPRGRLIGCPLMRRGPIPDDRPQGA